MCLYSSVIFLNFHSQKNDLGTFLVNVSFTGYKGYRIIL